MGRKKGKMPHEERRRLRKIRRWVIFLMDGGRCYLCGKKMRLGQGHKDSFTTDHVVPKSKGGTSRPDNLRACCHSCNTKKADKYDGPIPEPVPAQPSKKEQKYAQLRAEVAAYTGEFSTG